jgi:hypothetical protein
MKQCVALTALMVGTVLTACGGGDGGGNAGVSATTAAVAAKTSTPAKSAACALLEPGDLAPVFGASSPKGAAAASGTQCVYRLGKRSLTVTLTEVSANTESSFASAALGQHERRLKVDGAVAITRTTIKPNVTVGGQGLITIMKAGRSAQLVFTDTAKTHGSLTPTLTALAHAAAGRL